MKKLISMILAALMLVSCLGVTASAKDPIKVFFEEYGEILFETGDVDGDGMTGLDDVSHVLKYIAGWKNIPGLPEGCDPSTADVNHDGKVNLRDVSLMLASMIKYHDLTVCGPC